MGYCIKGIDILQPLIHINKLPYRVVVTILTTLIEQKKVPFHSAFANSKHCDFKSLAKMTSKIHISLF